MLFSVARSIFTGQADIHKKCGIFHLLYLNISRYRSLATKSYHILSHLYHYSQSSIQLQFQLEKKSKHAEIVCKLFHSCLHLHYLLSLTFMIRVETLKEKAKNWNSHIQLYYNKTYLVQVKLVAVQAKCMRPAEQLRYFW